MKPDVSQVFLIERAALCACSFPILTPTTEVALHQIGSHTVGTGVPLEGNVEGQANEEPNSPIAAQLSGAHRLSLDSPTCRQHPMEEGIFPASSPGVDVKPLQCMISIDQRRTPTSSDLTAGQCHSGEVRSIGSQIIALWCDCHSSSGDVNHCPQGRPWDQCRVLKSVLEGSLLRVCSRRKSVLRLLESKALFRVPCCHKTG